MKKFLLTGLLAFLLGGTTASAQANFNVVPRPLSVKTVNDDPFIITSKTRIYCGKSKAEKRNAAFLAQYIKERTGLELDYTPFGQKLLNVFANADKSNADSHAIVLLRDASASDNAEGYRLRVGKNGIVICGASDAGVFYGIQTLRKALPHRLVNPNNPRLTEAQRCTEVPATEICDKPRFAYRGAHLDVSRHFVTADSVRRFIDVLALHNMNRMHWHLTDDQGWRIEIKKYPRLTTVGAMRPETVIGHNSGVYDGIPHGGFYTQKECKEIVKYAAERNITIIPEIDMPGHMLGALSAYPELGCTGGPYEIWRIWGVSDDVLCAGNDKALKFVDDVLDEVTKIFPSQYIHVGGDECPKTAWKKCPKCQARIEAEGLQEKDGHSAEERLQSYVIRHAEAHLAKLGRRMIGWDETLEGGLADGATVMSWRGETGGIEAARLHHDAIMTPNTYLYFDYYQSLNVEEEPMGFGGYLPLERVYSYEPVPEKLLEEGLDKHIIGVQANHWTEYMPNFRQVEYMAMPRLAALADVQWTPRDTKDYDEFCDRVLRLMGLYDEQGFNYAKHIFNVRGTYGTDTQRRCITAELTSATKSPIFYTLDGSEPQKNSAQYTEPLAISSDTKLRACTFRPVEARVGSPARREERSSIEAVDFVVNKATASPIVLLEAPAPQYTFNGARTLVDGVVANTVNFQSGMWLGFVGKDMDVILDLGNEREISSVSINTNVDTGSWIFDACDFIAEAIDVKGDVSDLTTLKDKAARTLACEKYPVDGEKDKGGIRTHTLKFPSTPVRYLRLKATSLKALPDWHGGKGKPAFVFVDEITVK